MVKLLIGKEYNGIKLSKYIKLIYPKLPGSAFFKALRKKDIKINCKRINEDINLKTNDEITIYITDEILNGTAKTLNQDIKLDIVYEDKNIILVNKMPGISVDSDNRENSTTLIELVARYLKDKQENDSKPALCNRLDHYTGGIVIIAKNEESYKILYNLIKNRKIEKYYKCIVKGHINNKETLKNYLKKDSIKSKVYIFDKHVKGSSEIITKYRTIASGKKMSLLEVELVTGKTHQIRAHLAYIGHPILGDDKYGDREFNKNFGAAYQLLWAYKIVFSFDEGGILQYLKDKTFTTSNIHFNAKYTESEIWRQ